ncbi:MULTISPECIES: hypothetical protein [Burkholderia]|uniref:hypothetical protein n=1 Tax=Burkholderia TaxID=32008 RepID=UPI000A884E39|nr:MULTISPECIES: hypothetical protein [Burkholderia]
MADFRGIFQIPDNPVAGVVKLQIGRYRGGRRVTGSIRVGQVPDDQAGWCQLGMRHARRACAFRF